MLSRAIRLEGRAKCRFSTLASSGGVVILRASGPAIGAGASAAWLRQEVMSTVHSARIASICSPERALMTLSHRC